LPRVAEITLTPGIVIASVLLALLIALVMTLATQFGARDRALGTALRDGGRGQSSARSTVRLRAGLLIAQTALTTVLLVAAVLIGRSFMALMAVDAGYEDHGAVRVQLNQ